MMKALSLAHLYQDRELTACLQWLPHGEGLEIPTYATLESAGMDLRAAIESDQDLQPLQRLLVPCGFCMALPAGYEAQIRSRSGLALKNGVMVLNAPGTIDADYRGEVKVLLWNTSDQALTLTRGMRIAQMVVASVVQAQWRVVETLSDTERGQGGFGSTGIC